jgi:hypothetical protein
MSSLKKVENTLDSLKTYHEKTIIGEAYLLSRYFYFYDLQDFKKADLYYRWLCEDKKYSVDLLERIAILQNKPF